MADADKEANEKVLAEARERFAYCEDFWSPKYEKALESLRFSFGEQWPEELRRLRETDKGGARPCLTMPIIGQYVRQVVNDMRQNKPSIKPRPVDDGADVEVAEILQGLIRNIEDQSRATIAYDTAGELVTRSGFGWLRVCNEYESDDSANQDIRIYAVRNPFSVYLDPDFQSMDGSDAQFSFVFEDIPQSRFRRLYPNADMASFGDDVDMWWSEKHVRVAEYFSCEYEDEERYYTGDSYMLADEYNGLEEKPEATSRIVKRKKVMWYKITRVEVLESREFPAEYIGVIPVFGRVLDINGELQFQSLTFPAEDAQRMYNYSASAAVERVALAPKAKYLAPVEAVGEHADQWENAHLSNSPVLYYDHIDSNGQPLPPPQLQPGPDVPAAWASILQMMEHNVQAALGMYNASVGAPSSEKSGKAILARQREADISTFDLTDNLSRAICQLGRVIISMIPRVYDVRRIVRILGEDGQPKTAILDPSLETPKMDQKDETGKVVATLFNPNLGKYDVTVTVGPAYTTKRQEQDEWLTALTQSAPQLMPLIGDLLFKSKDMPLADQIAKRMKLMLDPRVLQAEEGGDMPPEALAKMQEMDAALKGAQEMIQGMQAALEDKKTQELEAQAKVIEQQNSTIELGIKDKEANAKVMDSETKRLQVLSDIKQAADDAQIEAAKILQEGGDTQRINELAAKVDALIQAVIPQEPMVEIDIQA